MTLAQLADFICTKARQNNAPAIAIAKNFLKQRHEMLWHEALWKDSLVQFTQTLSPTGYTIANTWLPTKGILLCPTIIERVLAARIADRKLNVQRQEYYFRIDYDSFARAGSATEFVLLPPCVWEFDTGHPRYFDAVFADSDNGTTLTADYLDTDGITVRRMVNSSITNTNEQTLITPATTERLDAFSKTASTDALVLRDSEDFTTLVTVEAGQSSAKKRQRIRLLELPPNELTIRVLGKRVCPTFTDDNDEPAISGVSNCLLAFALADVLQWLRQYGKAQAVQQEGVALLDQLKTLETVQQAHNLSIQPGQSYVSEWQFNSGAYSPLTF